MKNEDSRKYFQKIKEGTNGDSSSNSEVIDYQNGESISIQEIEDEYYNYLNLVNDIDEYIEDNDLNDTNSEDIKNVVNHFSHIIDEDFFDYRQACLIDFADYMIKKINKQNDKIRKANMMFNKNGNGADTTRITIPVVWAKQLGFTPENREGILTLDENKIILKKS